MNQAIVTSYYDIKLPGLFKGRVVYDGTENTTKH